MEENLCAQSQQVAGLLLVERMKDECKMKIKIIWDDDWK